jgi:hypothetical protein
MDEKYKGIDEPGKDTSASDKPVSPHEVEFRNDVDIDKVVDEIVNEDSDKLLAVEDAVRDNQYGRKPEQKKGILRKVKSVFWAWWNNKKLRYRTIIGLFILLIVGMLIPPTRYAILNTAGVRVKASMVVVDSDTGLPLKNIPVKVQDKEVRSDEDGTVTFENIKQGSTKIIVDKKGYAKYEKKVVFGWGSNPIGEQPIIATGAQYGFVLSDWLSKEPITSEVEATSGEDVATADEEGKVTLTVGEVIESGKVTIKAEGYREETIDLSNVNVDEYEVKMVQSKQHVFVSNRNGEYDIYKIYADKKNEQILLPATGKEREVPYIVPHQSRDYVAIVSSRDGDVNRENFVLDGLFVVDVNSNESYKVTRSEQLQVVGWSGDNLIYVAVVEGVSAGNSQRSRLISYDLDTKQRTDLAAANYFNDVKLVNDKVYYAVSSYGVPQSQAKLFSISVDGKDKRTLVDKQVWSVFRKDYATLLFNSEDQTWYQQALDSATGSIEKLAASPNIRSSRQYIVSPNLKTAVWVDIRDGKGVLLQYDVEKKNEKVIVTEAGLDYPVYWIGESTVVYRIDKNGETSDSVVNLLSGETQKISDVVGNKSRYFY